MVQTLFVLLSLCSSFQFTHGATEDDIATAITQLPDLVPFILRAAGEDCITPLDEDGNAQAEYDVQEHPLNPDALMVQVTIVMEWDCSPGGRWDDRSSVGHEGDRESFYMTLVKADCGWRVHAIKTICRAGSFVEGDITERIVEGNDCARPDDIAMSLGNHALYVSEADCSRRTMSYDTCGGDPRDALQYNLTRARRTFAVDACPDGELRLPDPGNQENQKTCIFGAEEYAGSCYAKCCNGYQSHERLCVEPCPSGFRDDGLYCIKPDWYSRGTGYHWQIGDGFDLEGARARCEKDHPQGCEQWGVAMFPKCQEGFDADSCCWCVARCPSTMLDFADRCRKDSYDRMPQYWDPR